jgi:hypothetical protein
MSMMGFATLYPSYEIADGGAFDLNHFERQQAKLWFNVNSDPDDAKADAAGLPCEHVTAPIRTAEAEEQWVYSLYERLWPPRSRDSDDDQVDDASRRCFDPTHLIEWSVQFS